MPCGIYGSYLVQGSISLEDLSEALGSEFTSGDAETFGGLVLMMSGGSPEDGESFEYGGWRIGVKELEEHRFTLLNMTKIQNEPEDEQKSYKNEDD